MLEKLPPILGRSLHSLRAGTEKLLVNKLEAPAAAAAPIAITSPVFVDGGPIPARYTADGEGLSPPLAWSAIPQGAAAMVLAIEDADSPTPQPLVHAIVLDMMPAEQRLDEGMLPGPAGRGAARHMGRNSYLRAEYLPPDPPPGHGPHRYACEIFALDISPNFTGTPGRDGLIKALRGHVLAKGCLIGTYERQ